MRRALLAGSVVVALASCGSPGDPPAGESGTRPGVTASPVAPAPVPPPPASTPPASSPAPPPSLQSAFETVRSGVTRLEVASCDGRSIGSGFQVSPTLVATVAHVVDEGQVIRVIQGTTSTAGTVVGMDRDTDVALVGTATSLEGHSFSFSDTEPTVGDQVAALGFPRGMPLAFSPGTVNALDRKSEIDGHFRYGLLEMDAATNHGSSGGPVIRSDGDVVGLVESQHEDLGTGATDQGRRLAVSSATAQPLIDGWSEHPLPVPVPDCRTATGTALPDEDDPRGDVAQASMTLALYFDAINVGDFATALAQLTTPGPLEEFRAAVASTLDTGIAVHSTEFAGDRLVMWVTFTSSQAPGRGPASDPQETCTDWSLDYVMARKNGLWLIDETRAHDGVGHEPCAVPATTSAAPGAEPAQPSGSTTPPS